MAYQVLARKWRPRAFPEMVGQTHVLRVLINALDSQRLHHAYLFTGTRGVGKTTVARIFAKSLNCERGIGASPCGECAICREIDAGRFVDLIEVDAASRTRVEDTRELLENVQYAPTRGRYKVYLIDEVHMLSLSSFNALLKTLEEPPPHVKFLLATTDPQKLPATILSRCLQFNLKRLPPEQISGHLENILQRENVEYEAAAPRLLAKAADGSMRDALSLLDQAIAFGGGALRAEDTAAMLGSLDQDAVLALLKALADGDAAEILRQVGALSEHNPDYPGLLAELLTLLQRLAVAQVLPASLDQDPNGDAGELKQLLPRLSPEEIQLFYQIGLTGRRDLPLAPDPRGGLEMVMLRMLAFRPAASADAPPSPPSPPQGGSGPPSSGAPGDGSRSPAQAAREALGQKPPGGGTASRATPDASAISHSPPPPPSSTGNVEASMVSEPPGAGQHWNDMVRSMQLGGLLQVLAENCVLQSRRGEEICLGLPRQYASLNSKERQGQLQQALEKYHGHPVKLRIVFAEQGADHQADSPAAIRERQKQNRQQQAVVEIENDPVVRALRDIFDARVLPESIRALDEPG